MAAPFLGPAPQTRKASRCAHVTRASAERRESSEGSMGRRAMLFGSAAVTSGLMLPGKWALMHVEHLGCSHQ